ncbi:DUF503 domain-containing protein [Evansella cellulosilytica]|uniref:DUF503 domain-containing protein n=1 Tax=Evansella cellulosilytica (strain ATCC 21833 / DSM 2522 / FERM P-1141 / JCM 9156 / N-4) TaxID=649639 RepID=E6TS58_EVAC2|nr:DUF503 domain-containing protein [Evansella cellulosilytica]ADU30712.1 protein of unknown function DUF503 [Evansella cellulosilytica DSM 2522]
MIIGLVVVEALIMNAHNLKDKRSVLKSVITKAKQRYNVSIVESSHQDVWQRAEWSIVTVGNSRTQAETEIRRAVSIIDNHPDTEITSINWEWL